LPQGVAKRFDGDVLAHVATMLEAVGDRLCHTIDRHLDSLDPDVFDACRQSLAGRTDDFEPQAWRFRCASLVGNRHPHSIGQLGGQPVLTKSAHQADDSVRDETGGFRKVVRNVLPDTFRNLVEAAAKAHEIAGVGQTLQIDQGDAGCCEVPGSRNAARPDETEGTLAVIHVTFGLVVINCRHEYTFIDEK